MDGALAKAPLGGEATGPLTDRAKEGRKRSLLTEGQGVPLGFAPAGANLNNFELARATIESIPIERPEPAAPQGLCLDNATTFPEVYELARAFRLHRPHSLPRQGGAGAQA